MPCKPTVVDNDTLQSGCMTDAQHSSGTKMAPRATILPYLRVKEESDETGEIDTSSTRGGQIREPDAANTTKHNNNSQLEQRGRRTTWCWACALI